MNLHSFSFCWKPRNVWIRPFLLVFLLMDQDGTYQTFALWVRVAEMWNLVFSEAVSLNLMWRNELHKRVFSSSWSPVTTRRWWQTQLSASQTETSAFKVTWSPSSSLSWEVLHLQLPPAATWCHQSTSADAERLNHFKLLHYGYWCLMSQNSWEVSEIMIN